MAVSVLARGNDTNGYATDFRLTAGDVVDVEIELEGVDITGYDVKSTINLATPLTLDIDNGGIVVTTAAEGKFRIVINSDVTAEWPACSFAYDLWTISPSGVSVNYLSGFFIVKEAVTSVP